MTTIADRLAEALRWAMDRIHEPTESVRSKCAAYSESWDKASAALAAYDASKGRDEPDGKVSDIDDSTEEQARELLAKEYQRRGSTRMAEEIRSTLLRDMGDNDFAIAIRAIAAARAPQGPGAEHWKQAIDEWVDDPVDSDEIEKRAIQLAGGWK